MPKGGPGRGQGRKATLSLRGRFVVCARFRKEWDELRMQRGREKHRRKHGDIPWEDIDDDQLKLHAVPLKDRKQPSPELQESINWISEQLDGRRIFHSVTPQAEREALLGRIALEESAARGVNITSWMIKRWLIEYDKFCKD